MAAKFKILSIDGGGLKGLIAIKILQVIESITGAATGEQFDLLAGTSTGGLIAGALAGPTVPGKAAYNLEHIETLYLRVAQDLFERGGLSYQGEEAGRLDELLKETFGSTRLSETKVPVVIPAFDVDRKKLVVFKTRSARQEISKDVSLAQVCRATSAIEPVFPVYSMLYHNREIRCADAGYHLKNPALSALAEVWKHREYYNKAGINEQDVILLSVSTGNYRAGSSDWSTNIKQMLGSQKMDMAYIREQKLDIDYGRIGFMRIDMNLGGSSFSLTQLLNWLSRIDDLSRNKSFREEIYRLLMS